MADASHVGAGEIVARRVLVRGHVQGVFFRVSTARQARGRAVVGWVRNCEDGDVEAHLQGPVDDVEAVIAWIQDGGPPAARVADLQVSTVDPVDTDGFILRG